MELEDRLHIPPSSKEVKHRNRFGRDDMESDGDVLCFDVED